MSALQDEIRAAIQEALRQEMPELLRKHLAVVAGPAPAAEAVSVTVAARLTGYSQEAILAAIVRGDLPASKPSGSRLWRIRTADLEAWLAGARTTRARAQVESVSEIAARMLGKGGK